MEGVRKVRFWVVLMDGAGRHYEEVDFEALEGRRSSQVHLARL